MLTTQKLNLFVTHQLAQNLLERALSVLSKKEFFLSDDEARE